MPLGSEGEDIRWQVGVLPGHVVYSTTMHPDIIFDSSTAPDPIFIFGPHAILPMKILRDISRKDPLLAQRTSRPVDANSRFQRHLMPQSCIMLCCFIFL